MDNIAMPDLTRRPTILEQVQRARKILNEQPVPHMQMLVRESDMSVLGQIQQANEHSQGQAQGQGVEEPTSDPASRARLDADDFDFRLSLKDWVSIVSWSGVALVIGVVLVIGIIIYARSPR
jgi:hypothetical protein